MLDGIDPKDLALRTAAEELWLWRRAKGLSAPRAAKALHVGRTALWRAESGSTRLHRAPPPVQDPSLPLLLRLARRRSGLGLRRAAGFMGISHQTLLNWEARGEEALVEWWRRRGYRFP